MTLLLDTHTLLWWLAGDSTLTEHAQAAIADPAAVVYVSSVSVWEIAIKQHIGKLDAPSDLPDVLRDQRFTELPFTARHGWIAGHLDDRHSDPFDRALAAQARTEKLTLVTRDRVFADYGVSVLLA